MNTDMKDNERVELKKMDITTEAHDILVALKAKESNFAYSVCFKSDNESLMKCYSILGSQDPRNNTKLTPEVGSEVRSCIIRFLFEAVDYFGEHREIVEVAIDYLDRFLLTRFRHDNENIVPNIVPDGKTRLLDIFVLASFGLAIKLFSPSSGCPMRGEERKQAAKLSKELNGIITHSQQYSFFVASSKGDTEVYNGHKYDTLVQMAGGDEQTVQIIERVEQIILSTLQWYVHPPTSFAIIHQIFQFATSSGEELISKSVQEMAYFQAELALTNPTISRPSIIAMSCVSNSFQRHLMSNLPLINQKCESFAKSSLDITRLVLSKMENSLEMSYEFDERIITMRGLLTNHLMECWRCKNELEVEKRMMLHSKAVNETNKNEVGRNRSTHQNDLDPCNFLDNFDSLFSYPSMKKENKGQRSHQKEKQESELIAHYNKHIRPKLYEEVRSSKSWPPSVHDSVDTSVNSKEKSGFFNLKDISGSRLVKKLRQTQGHFFTKKV